MVSLTLIDYGGSNMRSAQKAFEHLGARVTVTDRPEIVQQSGPLVLPGVGAFGAGIRALRQGGLDEAIHERVSAGVPLLGICLGMQLLFDWSEEMGTHRGLGLVPGQVCRISGSSLKVPHMGWNQLTPARTHPMLRGVPAGAYAYFVHSYYCDPTKAATVIATTDYGGPLAAVVGHEQIVGLQFHPEKSHRVGLQLLRNFLELP